MASATQPDAGFRQISGLCLMKPVCLCLRGQGAHLLGSDQYSSLKNTHDRGTDDQIAGPSAFWHSITS
ncbi:MAG: hypothetical protein CVV27_08925 [Candidatus Melainabacteria bacterium HGW-Melainabacteria-1]|nr:MAG: hypothetical protein CVV27_08925 [Candidatus Melainabacteria bacterium HGW-Melainabacteria-1]